jgi:hypothetical protein
MISATPEMRSVQQEPKIFVFVRNVTVMENAKLRGIFETI